MTRGTHQPRPEKGVGLMQAQYSRQGTGTVFLVTPARMWWWKDRSIRFSLLVGLMIRLIPMVIWAHKPCTHDECTYEKMANAILAGRGIVSTMGWLWAPAYPFLMAIMKGISGYYGMIQLLQLPAALATQGMVAYLSRSLYPSVQGEKASRWASWLYALNPTFIFYTCSDWSETLYGMVLVGALLMLGRARGELPGRGSPAMAGFLVGICVLFRGVATYILPIFMVGLLWERWKERKELVGMLLAAVLTVAPYSLYASIKFGGLVVSDRTLGQMMWLGNNTFEPATFDYGIGVLGEGAYGRLEKSGRPPCVERNVVRKDACEVHNGTAWILENPLEFLKRMPLRVSQLLNPHSFLTRHLRWGKWVGIPDWLDEGIIIAIPIFTAINLVVGTLGWFARFQKSGSQSWYPLVAGLVVLYHVGAIAVLAGLSRYRVPLEPLWLVMGAGVLADPRGELDKIEKERWRLWGSLGVCGLLFLLMLRFLPSGWPWWGSW